MNPDREIPSKRPKILCVDDAEANLVALHGVLPAADYELVEARSGYDALEKVRSENYEVILLDVQMPGMDGFETARSIHALESARGTPIIFLTAIHHNESYALQGYEAGAVDYIYKPLNPEILRAKVASFVAMSKAKVDISLLKTAEAKLREALKVRDEFLSIASHELKTPITPLQLQLQGFIRLIETGRLAQVPVDQLRVMLEISDAQVSRLSQLVDQLLNVTRIEEGRLSLTKSLTDLGDLIREMTNQFKYQLEASDSELEVDLGQGLDGLWDKLRLEQVLFNLISNAIKYAPGGKIKVAAHPRENSVILSVADDGIGIALEDQNRIFERFARAVPTENYAGLGLGLYVSKEIVQRHGGSIQVESAPGKGAMFTVELPRSFEPDLLIKSLKQEKLTHA